MTLRERIARAIRKAQSGSRWTMDDVADAVLAEIAAAGMVLVPREAIAEIEALRYRATNVYVQEALAKAVAMLSAAPSGGDNPVGGGD